LDQSQKPHPPSAGADEGKETTPAEAQIMTNLPRTRPQRRSVRRAATPPPRSASSAKSSRSTQGTRNRRRTATGTSKDSSQPKASRRRTPPPLSESDQRAPREGIAAVALGTAADVAKVPLKVGTDAARGAGRLAGRILRLR
jgi:hypothetical protein